MSSAKRNVLAGLLTVGLLFGAAWTWSNRQLINDVVAFHQYEPTQEIEEIVRRVEFSQHGKFLFYVNDPEVSDAADFNQSCQRKEAETAILGCYTTGRIVIYRTTSPELDGIREVTAAHEMLHAAWDRLSVSERQRLGGLLENVYEQVRTPRLDERMAYYERQQPGQRANELHSILGTEVAELGDELERHYAQFFNNRQLVVELHDGYEAVFLEIESRATALADELESVAQQLNSDIARYNYDTEQLSRDVVSHNQQLSAVDRTSSSAVREYNARQSELESRRRSLEAQRDTINRNRDHYDKLFEEYNSLAVRSSALLSGIDSLKDLPQ